MTDSLTVIHYVERESEELQKIAVKDSTPSQKPWKMISKLQMDLSKLCNKYCQDHLKRDNNVSICG